MAEKKSLTRKETGMFGRIKDRLTELESDYSQRNAMCDEIENMFLMNWTEDKPNADTKKHIKLTISPDARNKALGAIRLMTATDPKFSVPREKNDKDTEAQADTVEKAASAMWHMNGRVRQNQIHYDIVTSAVLFGEFHVGVSLTEDLVDYAKGSGKAAEKRIQKIADSVPALFDVYDPRTGYPEYDEFGLSAYYRKVETKTGAVLDKWGARAENAGLEKTKRNEQVNVCEYWDNIYHVVWLEDSGTPLLFAEHNLPCIPIIAQITDGSGIHEKEEYKRQPFLYTVWKSNLHLRQNLMLTIATSNLFAVASNPTFVYKKADENRVLRPDYSVPGGQLDILSNEDYAPLAKNTIDPAMTGMMDHAKGLVEESTIYNQTLGERLGGNAPYSMFAVVNQAGRLPLVTIQRRGSWGIGKAMEIAFMLMKDRGGKKKVKDAGSVVELSGTDIPEDLIIEATLDIDLPQDKKQSIQMAVAATSGDRPLLDFETARKDLLGQEQSDEIDKKVMSERYAWLEFQKDYQKEMAIAQAEVQQQIQQVAQQQQPQPLPQGPPTGPAPTMPPGAPVSPQPTPEQLQAMMQQMMQQQGVQSGLPLTEPQEQEGM